jgi:hypothetical protein
MLERAGYYGCHQKAVGTLGREILVSEANHSTVQWEVLNFA